MNLSFMAVCFGYRVAERARVRGACNFSRGWTAPPEQPNQLSVAAFDQFSQLKSLRSEDSKAFHTERLCSQRISNHSFTWKCSNVSACFSMEQKLLRLFRIFAKSGSTPEGIRDYNARFVQWSVYGGDRRLHPCLLLRTIFGRVVV